MKERKKPLPADPRALEKLTRDLERLLEEKNFKSYKEMEKYIKSLIGKPMPEATPRSTLDMAQELCYQAWETDDRKQRIRLARQALKLCKDCADAYVILAEDEAKSLEEARAYYEEGVRAGERALGKETFDKKKGHFWGILKTRPYMRARAGLARCLQDEGKYQQAIAHYKEMLKLNPNDNQGIRYELAICYAEAGMFEELKQLLFYSSYRDDVSALWLYTQALLVFREKGNSRLANRLLANAMRYNPYVPDYLLGKKKIPAYLPEYISPGDKTEAINYAFSFMDIWRQKVPGAIQWLKNKSEFRQKDIPRNQPCPCGSGLKYKYCCGA